MLFLFAFFFGGFAWLDNVLNFSSFHPGCTGILRLYAQKFGPLAGLGSWLLQPKSRSGGLHINKCNCENMAENYKQAEIPVYRDPSMLGHHGIPVSYKQALV